MLRFLINRLLPAILLLPSISAAELVISGVEGDVERNVRAFVSLAGEPCEAESWLIRRRFRSLEAETRKALEPFGYYDPQITKELTRDDACWQAMLAVDPGNPVVLRNVDIVVRGDASQDSAFDEILRSTPLDAGAHLRHADYDRLKRALQIRAADRGYVEARFAESRVDVWPEEGVADITLHLESGPRYRIGEIRQEQTFLEPRIVAGYLGLEPGAPYDSRDLTRTYRDLLDSAYFGRIEVVPEVEQATNGLIPIQVSLEPGTRIEYTIGVGASTDTGPRLRAGFRNNRVNRRGHRVIADLGVSPVVQGLTVEYRIPLSDPRREWFSVTAAVSNEKTDTFDNDAQRLGVRWTRVMSDTWLRTLSVDASNESFIVGTDIDTSRFIVPAVAFDHKDSDRDVFPTRGRRLGVEFRGTDESIGSTTSYFQTRARARWIGSFGTRNRLLARLSAGVTASRDFSRLPPSVRFFAGGDESVRGFDLDSLGPRDELGNVIGGNNLLVASIEYERHVRGNFYGAAFVDAGNAFDDTDFTAEVGAGLGLKWLSPLGPIRFYLGYPLTEDDPSVRFHLRLGADL